ncbi:MAG: hypothetical protein LH603_08375 [Pseudonocardia sp.]|nr:hypothetical protein [Pseudonocardia sp.]
MSSTTVCRATDGAMSHRRIWSGCRGRHDTRWVGPSRLLTAVEHAHALHHRLGAPALTAFGVTADGDGTRIWHDDPDGQARWPLP